MAKKKYAIPVVWRMFGTDHIEADNLMEAIEIARNPSRPLPSERSYIDDSFEVEDFAACLSANDIPEDVCDLKPEEIVEELNLRARGDSGKNSITLAGLSDQELVKCLADIYGIVISE